MQGIPKIIHCCWFGNGKKPKIVEECIKTWSIFVSEGTSNDIAFMHSVSLSSQKRIRNRQAIRAPVK